VPTLLVGIDRVRAARVRQVEHMVHLRRRQRDRRRVQPDITVAMALHQRPRIAGIGLQVQHAVGVRVQHRIALDRLEIGQPDHRSLARRRDRTAVGAGDGAAHDLDRLAAIVAAGLDLLRRAVRALSGGRLLGRHVGVDDLVDLARRVDRARVDLVPAGQRRVVDLAHEGGAADVGDRLDRLLRRQPVRDLDDRPLGVAVDQQVGLGVDQDRAPHLVRPVVVMRDAAQGRLDAADHHRHLLERLAAALRVDQGRAVRPLAGHAAGRVGVVTADLPVRRVVVDHRIHVPGGDAEEQLRTAERLERFGRMPVRLGNDADAKALRL